MIGFILIVIGVRPYGWCYYFQYGDRQCCICTWFFHVLWIPIFPLYCRVMYDVDRKAVCERRWAVAPLPCCGKYFWLGALHAWLRCLCLGLLWGWRPQADEATQNEIIEQADMRNQPRPPSPKVGGKKGAKGVRKAPPKGPQQQPIVVGTVVEDDEGGASSPPGTYPQEDTQPLMVPGGKEVV